MKLDLTPKQVDALEALLKLRQASSIKSIATRSKVKSADVQALLKKLEKVGAVMRKEGTPVKWLITYDGMEALRQKLKEGNKKGAKGGRSKTN